MVTQKWGNKPQNPEALQSGIGTLHMNAAPCNWLCCSCLTLCKLAKVKKRGNVHRNPPWKQNPEWEILYQPISDHQVQNALTVQILAQWICQTLNQETDHSRKWWLHLERLLYHLERVHSMILQVLYCEKEEGEHNLFFIRDGIVVIMSLNNREWVERVNNMESEKLCSH